MKYGFMIASTGSGCGKTTVTCAMLELMKRKYDKVTSFKCGPDYIDPMFHREVLGISCRNLDLFFSDANQLRSIYYEGNDSDVSVVEGVMGLYDGLSPESDEASSYHIACVLDIPVILVVDAKGMGRSVLAVIRGFLDMDREKRIKGVILNRVSKAYAGIIAPIIEHELGVKVVGSMPVIENVYKSRHLGLVLPEETADIKKLFSDNALRLDENLDLDSILDFSENKSRANGSKKVSANESPKRSLIPIAVARDEAFCFIYEDNIRLLEAHGAKIIYFSPLKDKELPKGIKGLILYGGYPELYANRLSANRSLLMKIREAVQGGLPVLAECGGFMYLHEFITTQDGSSYPMAGVIKGRCGYTGHLVRFGYASYTDKDHIFLPEEKDTIKGHEFHYFDSDAPGTDLSARKPKNGKTFETGYISPVSVLGYQHLYYPSNTGFVKHFLKACACLS